MSEIAAFAPPADLKRVGMISGNGIYPETFARAARAAGIETIVSAAFENETEPHLLELVDTLEWMRVGQLGKMIKFFKKHDIEYAVMVGQIAPKNLFDLRPDLRLLKMLSKIKERNAESLFTGIANELEKEGVELISAVSYLDKFLPAAGQIAGPELSERQEDDATYGIRMAKEISRLDIGQTVIVKKGTVLAVEAFEGTNEAIKRGGAMGKGEALMAKVSKPNQDVRFDVPCVGPDTVDTAAEAGVKAIAIEAGCTLLLGQTEIIEKCEALGISLVAVDAE